MLNANRVAIWGEVDRCLKKDSHSQSILMSRIVESG